MARVESEIAQNLADADLVNRDELLMSQMIQLDAICQLMIEKGVITGEEFFLKLKRVQAEYQARKAQRG